ncbi:MAG: molybdenum cofactor guanylyltransferase [Prolixibacteraceae bacterium]|jgi:molybdopterin-guanine dinucleotide biosynthesis protein A|nr:molybdenum cofactor guanylyltransferase [Prolixibacteraceae bacterium]
MKKELTGIILSGGKSSRMGQDKGLMDFREKKMVQYSIDVLSHFTNCIIISSNDSEYRNFGFPLITDMYKDCGPVGGLHAALSASETDWNLVLACDLPFMNAELFHSLSALIDQQDAILPIHSNGIEPLAGIYHKQLSSFFAEKLQKREFKLHAILKERDIEYFDASGLLERYPKLFANINTSDDLKN